MTQPRSVIIGAGAIGGTLAAEMVLAGLPVTLVARGAHFEHIRDKGLRYTSRLGVQDVAVPVVPDLAGLGDLTGADIYLCVKSQDCAAVLDQLDAVAPRQARIILMQNGVANETLALRYFPHVFGALVLIAGTYLEAGSVENPSWPTAGLLDIGACNPADRADAAQIAARLRAASFASVAVDDIMPWKYAKLLQNLGTPVVAAFAPGAARDEITRRAKAEGEEVLRRSGIAFTEPAVFEARRNEALSYRAGADSKRAGGSVYQSLSRGSPGSEVPYTTGEILMLARRLGLEAPVNAAIADLISRIRHHHLAPQSCDAPDFLAALPDTETFG